MNSASYALQQVINNQDQFEAHLLAPWSEQDAANADYVINPQANNVPYIVSEPSSWQINDGIEIELGPDVEIRILGIMETTPGHDGSPSLIIRKNVALDNWKSISIIGGGAVDDNIGSVRLLGAHISGGGSGDLEQDGRDWRGLVVLSGTHPLLKLGDPQNLQTTSLGGSLANGIVVRSETEDFSLRLYKVNMIDDWPSITLSGIKVNDRLGGVLQQAITNDAGDMTVEDCSIMNAGHHGVAVHFIHGGEYHIRRSIFNDNGFNFDDDFPEEPGDPNQFTVGVGIYFNNLLLYNQAETTLDITNSQINSNSGDGIRFRDMMACVWIHEDTEVDSNGRRGIYYDFKGMARKGILQDCLIQTNGWEGIYAFKGPAAGAPVCLKIRKCNFIANATNLEGHPLNGSPQQIANISLNGKFELTDNPAEEDDFELPSNIFTEILNNRISGANTGIYLRQTHQDQIFGTPKNIWIKNNIQFGAKYAGLRVDNWDLQNEDQDHPGSVHNNVFFNNGTDEGINYVSGIFLNLNIEPTPGFIMNNLLVENEDYGICYGDEDIDDFIFMYNGFYNNAVPVNNGTSDPGVGIGDNENSRFVDPLNPDPLLADFHLLWNSPMINRGNTEDDFADAPYPANGIPRDGEIVIVEEEEVMVGSRNDIGAYGGPGAALYGYEPYCAIDAAHYQLSNPLLPQAGDGARQWLENDYYRIYSNVEVPDGATFDIGDPTNPEPEDIGKAYFEFMGHYSWTVKGIIGANGNSAEDASRDIYFAGPNIDYWGQFLLQYPDATCNLNGCQFRNAASAVRLSGATGAGVPIIVNVYNSFIEGGEGFYQGLYVSNRIKLDCQNSEITNTAQDGVYFSYNEQLENEGDRSILTNISIHDAGASYAGVYCYRSTSRIVASHIFHNGRYGVRAALEGNPFIKGVEGGANSIVNNGTNHTDTYGAEVLLGNSSMDILDGIELPSIRQNNLYDVRSNGAQYVRFGRIISNTGTVLEVDVANNYFGEALWDEYQINFPEGQREFVEAEDFYDPNGLLDLGAIEPGELDDPKWEMTGDGANDRREPANGYEVALYAISEGDLREAASELRGFITNAPESRLAPAAVSLLFRVCFTMEEDLGTLRRQFREIAENTQREYPALAWAAQRSASRALYHEGRFEEFINELHAVRDRAPNELESLYVDMDVLLAEDLLDGENIDALQSRYQRMDAVRQRLDEVEAELNGNRDLNTVVREFALTSIYPNPFNSVISFQFAMPQDDFVEIAIFDVSGRQIAEEKRWFTSGSHRVVWRADREPAGVYLMKVSASGNTQAQKITLVK